MGFEQVPKVLYMDDDGVIICGEKINKQKSISILKSKKIHIH